MIISMNTLSNKPIAIEEIVYFPKEKYTSNLIVDAKNILVKGEICLNTAEEIILDLRVSGILIILDAYSKEAVEYNIDFPLEENLGEISLISENTLDILDVLWENTVLEVPIRFVSNENAITKNGDGWELVDETKEKVDPRLKILQNLDLGREE